MRPGTVAANYYRTARSAGGPTKRPKARTRKAATTTKRTRTRTASRGRAASQRKADTDLTTMANQISDLVQQLVRSGRGARPAAARGALLAAPQPFLPRLRRDGGSAEGHRPGIP